MTKKSKQQWQKYAENEEVAPARICKKTNNANVSNLAKKKQWSGEQNDCKKIRQASGWIFNSKKQNSMHASK